MAKGRKLSEEHKRKLSVALKGRISGMKGKKHTKESKKKMSESMEGEKNPNYGRNFLKKHRINISESQKGNKNWLGKHHTEKTKMKISKVNKGMKRTDEARKNMREVQKKVTYTNSRRFKKGTEIWLGRKHSEESKRKIGEGHKRENLSVKTRKRLSKVKSGERNPQWLGGKSFEPYDQNFNITFKRFIRNRDNQICILCGIHREKLKKALSVHHIDYNKQNTCESNCCALCNDCNLNKVNNNRKHWTIFFQSLLKEKYGY